MFNHSLKTGLSFGLTSGIMTTLGLLVGLSSGTHSKLAVLGGILTIAVADAFSDALGIHMSEESEAKHAAREIWQSTVATFLAKFIFALIFAVPILLLNLPTAVVASVIWGFLALGVISFLVAKSEKIKPWKVVSEHLLITLVVVVVSHLVGAWISATFGKID